MSEISLNFARPSGIRLRLMVRALGSLARDHREIEIHTHILVKRCIGVTGYMAIMKWQIPARVSKSRVRQWQSQQQQQHRTSSP